MKNKKLIIFNPSIEGGGVEKNMFIIANFLATKISGIKLIASNYHGGLLSPKIEFVTIKNKHKKRIGRYIISLYLLIKEILKDKNILILSFQANIYAIIICSIFKVPIIIRSNSSPTSWAKGLIKKQIYKFFFRYPLAVIVNSNEFKKKIYQILRVKSICIYNPLNKKTILKKAKNRISFNFFKKKYLNIISVGRLTDQKNHILTLKALNSIKNKIKFKFLILGRGEKKIQLLKFIKTNNMTKYVSILNYKKNPYPYFKKSDLFILSSRYEGLPNVLLEAMTLKKPIISSNCPTGTTEILEKGKFGTLFRSNNYLDLRKKIIFFKKNQKKIINKTNEAYKSLDRFSFNKNLYKYYKLLKSNICNY